MMACWKAFRERSMVLVSSFATSVYVCASNLLTTCSRRRGFQMLCLLHSQCMGA